MKPQEELAKDIIAEYNEYPAVWMFIKQAWRYGNGTCKKRRQKRGV
jgi:hypothetical protein